MEEEQPLLNSINLQKGLFYTKIITMIGIILFKSSEILQLETLINKKCPKVKGVTLIESNQQFWLLKQCQLQNEIQLQEVERMVGLTETIICLELSNSFESIIEKLFCSARNQAMNPNSSKKLIFVKEIYHNKSSLSDVRYFQNIQKVLPLLEDKVTFETNPITITDLAQIYDCQKAENIPKVSMIHKRYEQIRCSQSKIAVINELIFNGQKSNAEIIKQIQKLNLKKQIQNKLIWKMEQMNRYRGWLQEQKQSVYSKCDKLTFLELNDKINFASVVKYHRDWRGNSFLRLKKLFNKIGSQIDSNAVKDFQKEYRLMRANLQKVKKGLLLLPEQNIFEEIIKQLDDFYGYHQSVIDNKSLSSFNFIKEEVKYIWRYKNNIYKKIAAFFLFGALAYCQEDYISALTLYILAVITLALRC